MNRRNWLTTAAVSAAGLFSTQLFAQDQRERNPNRTGRRMINKHPNSHYYKDGKFDAVAAKEAYQELFRFHRYSIADAVMAYQGNPAVGSTPFWMLNFGLGDFSNVGMGGIFFVNDKEHGYFAHEIYLLPGQMIPEHFHIPAEDKAAKHEFWQVRNGSIWTLAQGGSLADLPSDLTLPKSQLDANAITCFKAKKLVAGQYDVLNKLEEPHFMIAGPEGAIVSEYASYHSGDGLRFTNKKATANE